MSARVIGTQRRKTMTIRKPVVVGIATVAALSACTPIGNQSDNNYHGTVGAESPTLTTVSTPSVPAYPVTISGNGESVETADLVAHGYTVTYQASSNCLIAAPVEASGEDGSSIINQCAHGEGPVSGTTTYRATGRATIHVFNTSGEWSLTFTPLS